MKLHPLIDLILARVILIGVLLIFPTIVIWGIWSIITNDNAQNNNKHTQQMVWVEQSKDTVRARLKDPRSAEFKDVYFSDSSGTPVACGQVNSKNTYGGYTGFQYFVAAGENMAFFERETDDFSKVWNEMCVP